MRTRLSLLAAVLAASAPATSVSAADDVPQSPPPTTATCEFRTEICAGVGVPSGPATPSGGGQGGAGQQSGEGSTGGGDRGNRRPTKSSGVTPTTSPYKTVRTPIDGKGPEGEPLFGQGTFCSQPGSGDRGLSYVDRTVDTRDGSIVGSRGGCQVPSNGGAGGPTGGGESTDQSPPTATEIWQRIPVPTPSFGMNPAVNGLTGLETWLWSNDAVPITATVQLRGYTATATARPVRWEWRMWQDGDTPNVNPDPVVVAYTPGSEAQPAARYTYETNGDFTVTETVTWTGTFTTEGPDAPPQTSDLGESQRSSSRTYHVIAVRGAPVH